MWLNSVEGAILSGFSMARMSPASVVGHIYYYIINTHNSWFLYGYINVAEQFSVPASSGFPLSTI